MRKVIGNKGVKPLECMNPKANKWRVRWNIIPDETEGATTAEYMEEDFDHKPTEEEVRQLLVNWYNEQTDEKILSGFEWRGMEVWLSSENQFNYKAAHDLAVQTQGATLPVTFKFGTDDNPTYYQFNDVEELSEFYVASVVYVQEMLQTGWAQKDAINTEIYK